MRMMLATVVAVAFALTLSTAAGAATIVVNSLADPGRTGICALRDAITAANKMTKTNGCAAGTGNDTIQFSVTGTLHLASTLPQVTDRRLTITGPASPGITIDGGKKVQVMQVASSATLNLKNLTIADGFCDECSSDGGGGISNGGTLMVMNSTFSNNGIAFGSGNGGAIMNSGTLSVTNSTFSGNGSLDGAGIYNSGTLSATNSTFSDNIATASVFLRGGGIYNDGVLIVTNSTFAGNGVVSSNGSQTGGGGIYNDEALIVTNSTFAGNVSASGQGGAIFNTDFASLNNTIVAADMTSAEGSSGNCSGTIIDAGYNISDDNTCEFSATSSHSNTNPLLDPAGLRDNGGPTETIALDSESPAIDAIPFANCTDQFVNRIPTDQRGALRFDAGELQCDIGAYEFQDFAGQPLCGIKNISALIRRFGSLEVAASALGFPGVKALLKAIQISCGG
jgi:hypothetical protein